MFLRFIILKPNVVRKQEGLVLGPSSPIACLQHKSSICTPPPFFLEIMDRENEDPVRPSLALSLDTLTRSISYWKDLFARAQSASTLPESCYNLKGLLNNTPSIPQSQDVLEHFQYDMMLIKGYAT
ncbi:hypothetical protein N7481_011768 [Penicillium waksmanii]|uniref:uncharacterized protein n=1 Tax=Penicillium waksmanii TaxID=69791 RepID=UPI002547FE3C|nr:uncharacterized protein N7481_011768 [Penicillium waksmanii]KAJ5974558.1 hypothetical protein N7481_011768 [Penicillium waksmanii]